MRGGYGSASHTREKSASEMERLGMGMGRLGFGQVGGGGKPAAAPKKGLGGFDQSDPLRRLQKVLLIRDTQLGAFGLTTSRDR